MPRLLPFVLIVLVAGCPAPSEPESGGSEPDVAGEVRIRIANESNVAFERVFVAFPGETREYGAIPAGSASAYHVVRQAYRYAYIEVHAAGDTLVLQPIDYVGESLLAGGSYTYALDVEPGSRYLIFDFRPH